MTTHKEIDVKGLNFKLIPFNSGRRICPGVLFAVKILKLILTNILHWFEIETLSNKVIDICEDPGITNLKTTPLDPTFVYQSSYC
ncbi:hypothetical protein Goklo_000125, partial [Gossypium klotzschianum]|nr:hypothetical protein [Gossypium klotzschianum]